MNKPADPALAYALSYLRTAERTEVELRAHLVRKKVIEADVERVVAHCLDRKFVSNERLAEREVELAKTVRKSGKEKTAQRLAKRGMDEDTVHRALTSYSTEDEARVALEALSKKFQPDDAPDRGARFLAARGFSEETVWRTLAAFFTDFQSEG